MANEISLTLGVQVKNGYHVDKFEPGTIQITQSSPGRGGHVQVIGTSPEAVSFGDVATNGLLLMRNLDTTNYVTFGPDSNGTLIVMGKMKPGEVAAFRVAPTVTMKAQADTNSVKVDVRLYED